MQDFFMVDNPLIEHVIGLDGREHASKEFTSKTLEEICKLRKQAFREGDSKILCSSCHSPVYPKRQLQLKKYHFSHTAEANCPYQDKDKKTRMARINAMRYNGQKEGSDHKHLKEILIQSIKADKNFDPEIRIEKNWYGSTDESKWRRPDVAAHYVKHGELRIAFEIQLSLTFLRVMAARENFYKQENALLFWIFKEVDLNNPKQYQEDIFRNNNSNIFVVNEKSLCHSKEKGEFYLWCYFFRPNLRGDAEWSEPELVGFDILKKEIENQRVYFFDFEGERARLIEKAAQEKKTKRTEELRQKYITFWGQYCNDPRVEFRSDYSSLLNEFKEIGILIPNESLDIKKFNRLVFSAKQGYPTMTGFKTLLEIANNGYDHGKKFMWYFGRVLKRYPHSWTKLKDQDSKALNKNKKRSSWEMRASDIKKGYEGEFKPDRNFNDLFFFLFPEVPKD